LNTAQECLRGENSSLDQKLSVITREHKQSLIELTEISVKNEKL